jgi:nitrate/TMAO reductase-like tetraheme cytochrome c subunit
MSEEKTIENGSAQSVNESKTGKPGIVKKLKALLTKKNLIIIGVVFLVIVIGGLLKKYVFKSAPKAIYEVAIMVRDQRNSDPSEDLKNSLKKGDVLVVQKDGHTWSKNESISYLILKMELNEEQKQKLTSSEEKEIKFKDLSQEEQDRINEEKKRAEEEGREYFEEPRRETLRARAYHIPLNQKEFEGFEALDLMNGQPFQDEVYGWSIVEKKERVK